MEQEQACFADSVLQGSETFFFSITLHCVAWRQIIVFLVLSPCFCNYDIPKGQKVAGESHSISGHPSSCDVQIYLFQVHLM